MGCTAEESGRTGSMNSAGKDHSEILREGLDDVFLVRAEWLLLVGKINERKTTFPYEWRGGSETFTRGNSFSRLLTASQDVPLPRLSLICMTLVNAAHSCLTLTTERIRQGQAGWHKYDFFATVHAVSTNIYPHQRLGRTFLRHGSSTARLFPSNQVIIFRPNAFEVCLMRNDPKSWTCK